jgi:uncharacterized protein (DUF2267 family)
MVETPTADQPEAHAHEPGQDENDAKQLLDEIAKRAKLPEGKRAKEVLCSVMCVFGQHVSGGEARRVWSELPESVRPLLETCLVRRDERAKRFGRGELVDRVADRLGISGEDAERAARSVLGAISSRLPLEEVLAVATQLPKDLRELWVVGEQQLPVRHPLLADITRRLALPEGVSVARAFSAVMSNVSRRLTLGEARHLVRALPPDMRSLLEPSLRDREEAPERFGRDELLARVAREVPTDQPEIVAREVIHTTERYISKQAFKHVRSQLPADLNRLWTAPV